MKDDKEKMPLCGLREGCWDSPCQKEQCVWIINKEEAKNCFLLYKYMIEDTEHTLHEIADIFKTSHTTIKQIEGEALKKIKDLL